MKQVTCEYPPGTIGVPCGDLGRYHCFTQSVASVYVPEGTSFAMNQGLSIPLNLNSMIAGMLSRPEDQWFWFLGDDMAFAQDSLLRLLESDKDIVVPVVPRRRPRFGTVLYKPDVEEGLVPMPYADVPFDGMIEVPSAGTGGMLVKRAVFEAIEPPWFVHGREDQEAREDLEFCTKVTTAGFRIHVNPSVRMGHAGMFIAWPVPTYEQWKVLLQFGPRQEDHLLVSPEEGT